MNFSSVSLLAFILSSSLAFTQAVTPRARAIHNSAIIVDTHADTPQRFLYEDFDIGTTDPKDIGHISLDKARTGNLAPNSFHLG
jgi:membrane dipeptidase